MEPSWAQNFHREAASSFTFKRLEALLQISLAYWFSELQVLKTQIWSLRAPLPLSFLFSVPPVSSRLNCFSFSSFSHCTFHCETLVFLNALLELSIPLAHFLSELFLPFRLTPTLLLMRKIWLRDMQCWLCCLPARPQNSGAWPLEMKCNTAILSSV